MSANEIREINASTEEFMRQEGVKRLLSIAKHFAKDKKARAWVFLPDSNETVLMPYATWGTQEDDKADLGFNTRQGLVGRVFWNLGHDPESPSLEVNLENITPLELQTAFGLSPAQIKRTQEVKSILATRITYNNRVLGVLSVDSDMPPLSSGLLISAMGNDIMQIADQIGIMLCAKPKSQ
ncbi:MAG: hypothetical protein IPK52_19690 [Chloroflexi bacterium]|nr:hypothetical protein [Chloroflexota bacterium]